MIARLVVFVFILGAINLFGQGSLFDQSSIKIQPVLALQGWGVYTNGAEIFNTEQGTYDPVDDRLNFLLRRTNFGFKGTAYNRFKFSFIGAADFVGRDALSGIVGAANNGANPFFRLWIADLTWKALPTSDLLHFTFGYIPPQVSRESISSAFRISSMEKSWSQNYIRRHLVGTGPGRAIGLNVGGMQNWAEAHTALTYNLGLFNPTYSAFGGNSAGEDQALLWTYRLAIHFGDPEFATYSTSRKSNYFGKRKGITVAVSGSQNGTMARWESSESIGFDLLFNWENFNMSAEWMRLYRNGKSSPSSKALVGYIRASYNLNVAKMVVEPTINYVFYQGETDQEGQDAAILLGMPFGDDTYWELVLNAHLNANTKLTLGYTLRDGDSGFYDLGSTANNYFFQGGVGAIHRGDYLGLGFVFILA